MHSWTRFVGALGSAALLCQGCSSGSAAPAPAHDDTRATPQAVTASEAPRNLPAPPPELGAGTPPDLSKAAGKLSVCRHMLPFE
jgi:hypothetical protein